MPGRLGLWGVKRIPLLYFAKYRNERDKRIPLLHFVKYRNDKGFGYFWYRVGCGPFSSVSRSQIQPWRV